MDNFLNSRAVQRLLHWFRVSGVAYPWGENPTPYRVWVSEIMLQQTVVTAAIGHFKNWMYLFPDVKSLATAEEQTVLKAWEGLGYYSRARNLRKGAIFLMETHAGELPGTYSELLKVPGIGDYTARAILSLAMGQAYPVLDANVRRIGMRLLASRTAGAAWETGLLDALEEIIPLEDPGEFNCALMQLGQQVCRIKSPGCLICPLAGDCRAFKTGIQEEIPPPKKKVIKEKTSLPILLFVPGVCLLERRTRGIGEGLWFLPSCTPEEEAGVLELLAPLSIRLLPERVHFYTTWREKLLPRVYTLAERPEAARLLNLGKSPAEKQWIAVEDLEKYPTPSVYRKILKDFIEDC